MSKNSTDTLVASARDASRWASRLKVKVASLDDLDRVGVLRKALPDMPLAIDANGCFRPADLGELVATLDGLTLSFVEQPFPADDLDDSAALATAIGTPVCLDETVTGPAILSRALAMRAGTMVAIKPARLGGLSAALEAIDVALGWGAAILIGGMLETGIGRAASIALAAGSGSAVPADLAPADHYLTGDLLIDAPPAVDGYVEAPDGPGFGVTVDDEAVRDAALHREAF
jgi:O-succinylbenzoate synthase